jgi:hypothetical protein
MKSPYKMILPIAGFVVIAASGLVIAHVSAATNQNANNSDSLAQRIATKFHLNKNDVQSTIDQYKQDKLQQMESDYKGKLDQAVKDGKITPEQETKIIAEHDKLKTELLAAKDDQNTDRHTVFENVKNEATQWAQDNNIDVMWLLPGGPGHHGQRLMNHDQDSDVNSN